MIGKIITKLLVDDATVNGLVGGRIFAILMEENTKTPAISYTITEISPNYAKTTWVDDVIHFQVSVFTKSYAESNTVTLAVRNALERQAGTFGTTKMNYIYFEGYREEYDQEGDSYVLTLNFRTSIKQY